MKHEQLHKRIKGLIRATAFAGLLLIGAGAPEVLATDVGPMNFAVPTTATTTTIPLNGAPGKSLFTISGRLNALPFTFPITTVPMTVDVLNPQSVVVASFDITAIPGFSVPFLPVIPVTNDFGCPRNWRVRIHTLNGLPPPINVTGSLTFTFFPPGEFPNPLPAVYKVDMEGGSLHLEGGGAVVIQPLSAHHPLLPVSDRTFIQGTEGHLRVRSKWDTSFNLCYLNQIFQLRVSIRKSTATGGIGDSVGVDVANSFLTNASDVSSIGHDVTPAEAMLPGPWRLRIQNDNTVQCFPFGTVNVGIDNFDVENFFPSMESTFTPNCSEAVGAADVSPAEAMVRVGQPIVYEFTWTVPDGFNWHHLEGLQLRVVDGDDTAISALFQESTGSISLFNEKSGRFGPAFAPGSPNKLQTSTATLFLDRSAVEAAGPTSPTVKLKLAMSFKPSAAGKTFNVEAGATDKNHAGTLPGYFDPVGTITVSP